MNQAPSTFRRKPVAPAGDGFTLIELLTVIAIIGILASILIPTVNAVRESARNAECVSNLRQVGTGIIGAANDNNGRFPRIDQYDIAWNRVEALMQAVEPYMGEGFNIGEHPANESAEHAIDAWRCPTVMAQRFVQWSYYPNGSMWVDGSGATGLPMDSIPAPTRYPMIYDRGAVSISSGPFGNWSVGQPTNPQNGWHSNNRINAAFADGSVRGYTYTRDSSEEFYQILQEADPANWVGR
jgi:prepilin-type N-terminal cleavage/methylation domain-containing protein/prepilin-type processing-associated H-X9-DG protein